MKSRGDAEGNNQLDEREKESWRPHQYFIDILNTVKQEGTISITQHLKILLLTLLTFYTTALILRRNIIMFISIDEEVPKYNILLIKIRLQIISNIQCIKIYLLLM